jgi:hypothetical protein
MGLGTAIGAGVIAASPRDVPTPRAGLDGCVLRASPYGYPERYVAFTPTSTIHPPLLEARWRGPDDAVEARVLRHSLFHGYVVVEYATDIPPETIKALRRWVRLHASERATAAPAPDDAPFAVDAAKWGHELICSRASALTIGDLDRLLTS